MVKAIFSRWPYLQRIFNSNYDAIEIYRFRLRTYFKNARKKLVNVIPEVLAKQAIFGKRKSAENDLTGPSIKKGVMAWGVKNYLPPFQEGQDSRLNNQYNLSAEKRDERIIRKLMDLAFPHWRQLLINEIATIQDVVDLYPILKDERQLTFYFSLYASASKKKISLKVVTKVRQGARMSPFELVANFVWIDLVKSKVSHFSFYLSRVCQTSQY